MLNYLSAVEHFYETDAGALAGLFGLYFYGVCEHEHEADSAASGLGGLGELVAHVVAAAAAAVAYLHDNAVAVYRDGYGHALGDRVSLAVVKGIAEGFS